VPGPAPSSPTADNPLLRGSLNAIDKDRHFPGRLEKFVGPHVPSADTVGRVYAQLDSGPVREALREVHLRILHTVETERCRERIAKQWKEMEKTSSWY
jgi:hypothetical protein